MGYPWYLGPIDRQLQHLCLRQPTGQGFPSRYSVPLLMLCGRGKKIWNLTGNANVVNFADFLTRTKCFWTMFILLASKLLVTKLSLLWGYQIGITKLSLVTEIFECPCTLKQNRQGPSLFQEYYSFFNIVCRHKKIIRFALCFVQERHSDFMEIEASCTQVSKFY